MRPVVQDASVVDLFCGAGGLSQGFYQEGFRIAAGVDADEDCRHAFERNNGGKFLRRNIVDVTAAEVADAFGPASTRILVGCAPCQPFSNYNQANLRPDWNLLLHFGRLVRELQPEIVSMENVPSLERFAGGAVFSQFKDVLKSNGYHFVSGVVRGTDYGLPQSRSRLVLIASRLGPVSMPECTGIRRTIRDAIGSLPPINAGSKNLHDPLHQASGLTPMNLKRMRASRPGRTWSDWPETLKLPCHKRPSGKGYGAVYGRLSWDQPAPTITTQFYNYGSGRFGHPEQDRALSLREGAILQGFPSSYEFVPANCSISITRVARMIGNAVPVDIAKAIARTVKVHLENPS